VNNQVGIEPNLVINTSTEHVTQEVYDNWYNAIPAGTLIVIQSNDYFKCDEHIRCSRNLKEFLQQNSVVDAYYSGTLDTDMYARFMAVWRK